MKTKIKVTPPILYKWFIVLMLVTILLPIPKQIHFPFNLPGILLLFSGSCMAIGTKRMFQYTQTPMNHFETPVKLDTIGIFRFTRNPMYLGITIGLAGIAIITGILYNLIFAIIYLIVMDIYFVGIEEEKLQKEFGEIFTLYKRKTRKWL